jgi:3D (Asp-Asp-Asp) domain-containing protein
MRVAEKASLHTRRTNWLGRSLACICLGIVVAVVLPTSAPRAVDPSGDGLLAPPIGGPDATFFPEMRLEGQFFPVATPATAVNVEVSSSPAPAKKPSNSSAKANNPNGVAGKSPSQSGSQDPNDLGTLLITCYSLKSNTASGAAPDTSTAAADPRFLSLGTVISIEGLGTYTIKDYGPLGRKIDIWMPSEGDCRAFGKRYLRVRIVSGR